MDRTALGDRMKAYERREDRRAMPLVPLLTRADGQGFSRFTRDLRRPFDDRLSAAMVATTRDLVAEFAALAGYTQSDDITLLWHTSTSKGEVPFGGRVLKLVSVLAATATIRLHAHLSESLPGHAARRPVFDGRAWSVPTEAEAAACLLWRERDATKNSISMAARAHFSHAASVGKCGSEMQAMLLARGVNWNDYPAAF